MDMADHIIFFFRELFFGVEQSECYLCKKIIYVDLMHVGLGMHNNVCGLAVKVEPLASKKLPKKLGSHFFHGLSRLYTKG